ncbi:MAG: hypothetical protein EKK68_15590 [Candidatus Competibacteraceae bacterium]|nr:MAG: hypothetical protein EKK68_15590 [Candidatus Competibacteraceae bacterium]
MNTTRIAALFLVIILNSAAADEFALLKKERIGPLRFDQPAAEAERLITCPVQRGPVELWGADGEYHQTWTAPACGLTLDLSATKPSRSKTLTAITLTRPSSWKTARGIGIGSTEREVVAAYGRDREKETSVPGERLVAGTAYGGLVFTFHQGRVTRIFLGAAAE